MQRAGKQAMKLPPFDYACPTSVAEAVALLAAHDGEAKPLAGGQSLVPMLAFRIAAPALVVDLRKLSDLRRIKITADGVTLGAMTRWRDILDDAQLAKAHPLLVAAVRRSPITRSATAAPSAAVLRMPILPPKCRASR
jgi:carbon-monoxide dehydrogenase medium subunit